MRNCFASRTASTRSAGPVTQPTFQPVNENVLPAELMDSVRSRMPGEGGDRHVRPVDVEDHVLVDLVDDDHEVVLDGDLCDGRQLARATAPSRSGCAGC